MSTISMSSARTAWHGEIEYSINDGYVSAYLYTWKSDGVPSSAASGASFTATLTVGGTSETFRFQQQEAQKTFIGSVTNVYVSALEVNISARVEAPYGVSMYGYPLTGSAVVTVGSDPPTVEPSQMRLSADTLTMGDTLRILLLRSSVSCYHNVSYYIGGVYQDLIGINVANSCDWTVPDLSGRFALSQSLTVTILCQTYLPGDGYEGSYVGETRADVTVTLPRATVPSCSAGAEMGSTLAITLPRENGKYTHDLFFDLAGTTAQIAQGVGESCSWEIPLTLAKAIPTAVQGTCTITCVTRLDTLEVGTENIMVTLRVPDNDQTKPQAAMALSPSGDLPAAFAGMYIRGKTGVKGDFTASSEYSQIKSCQLVVDGIPVSGDPAVSAPLNAYGQVTVTGRVTDARGFVRELAQSIFVYAYEKPRVIPYTGESSVAAVRCDADGTRNPLGQSLLIRAGRKYTALQGSAGQKNLCTLQYRYKPSGAESYGDFYDLMEGDSGSDYAQLTVMNILTDVKSGYTVQLRAADTLGSFSVLTIPVGAAAVPLHIGQGNGNVAVGKYCDYSRENAFEIGLTTYFDTGIALRGIFTEGSWAVGTELGSAVAEADTNAAARYTLFIAVCEGAPVWLMKLGTGIWGSGVKISMEDNQLTLTQAPAAVTGMYAVL